MKKTIVPILFVLVCTGCSHVTPSGKNTYMVQYGGWPHMSGFAMKQKCLRDADRFCRKRGLGMVPVNATVRDGQAFVNNASCEFVFKAVPTNSPEYAAGTVVGEEKFVK